MSIELECPKCGHIGNDYTLVDSGPHNAAKCAKCSSHIKNLSQPNKYYSIEKKQVAFEKTNGFCAYCGINPSPFKKQEHTIDHLISQNDEGGHEIENLYISCKSCNSQKGKKTVEDYREYLERKYNLQNHKFWFELIDVKVTQPKHIADILKEFLKTNISQKLNNDKL